VRTKNERSQQKIARQYEVFVRRAHRARLTKKFQKRTARLTKTFEKFQKRTARLTKALVLAPESL